MYRPKFDFPSHFDIGNIYHIHTGKKNASARPLPLQCACDCSCDVIPFVLLPDTTLFHQHCPIRTFREYASTDTYLSSRRSHKSRPRLQAQVTSPSPQSLWRSITSVIQALPFSPRIPVHVHPCCA